jgi:tRNA(fMet)-specific endonuclease VapC
MIVLDTDHLSVLERGGAQSLPLQLRLSRIQANEIVTTIVNYEEQMRGWLARASRAKTLDQLTESYNRLQIHIETFVGIPILPFNAESAAHLERLYAAGIRIGTMDRRIAAIALAHNATLLTRNLTDFEAITALVCEDWTA